MKTSKKPKYNFSGRKLKNLPPLSPEEPIQTLKLPKAIESALLRANILTVGKLYSRKRKRLKKIKHLGTKSVSFLMKTKHTIELKQNAPGSMLPTGIDNVTEHRKTYSHPTTIYNYSDSPIVASSSDAIEVLGLPLRLENTLKTNDVWSIGELYTLPIETFYKFRNIGSKSVSFLIHTKKRLQLAQSDIQLLETPVQAPESHMETPQGRDPEVALPNNQLLEKLLERCPDERSTEIIKRRYGLLNGERETLEEIGQTYDVTRERIRQIQQKTIKRLRHPSFRFKEQLTSLAENIMLEKYGLISDEEADSLVPEALNNAAFDGSATLDLLSDMGWIQKHTVGDINIYSPKFEKSKLGDILENIVSSLREQKGFLVVEKIRKHLSLTQQEDITSKISLTDFLNRACRIDPRIEESVEGVYSLYSTGHRAIKLWVPLIVQVLEEENAPLHFTEIAHKVNDRLTLYEHKLEVHRLHSILIDFSEFAHIGIRGTYGLAKWGFRKESTPEVIKECLKKAGFPLHWKQIYNYVAKYKDSKPASIMSILENNRTFKKISPSVYGLRES